MNVGVPKENFLGESRVAVTPDVVQKILKLGFHVFVENGAGLAAQIPDEEFTAAGAVLVSSAFEVWQKGDLILKVRAPTESEVQLMRRGQTVVSFIWPAQNPELLKKMAATGASVLAMDCVPRISRAQKVDALSSMANIAGYRAIVEAAHHFGRFFTGQITAAGKVPPAKVLVIGAGVAGLSAIGTASSLGAIVRAFDTRLEVKDQVKSMGGEFLELDFQEDGSGVGGYAKQMSAEFIKAEMELFARQAREVDIIVTTALIPGKPAPKLITLEMVKSMKPGSVIVDLAAEFGGNCEATEHQKVVNKFGVTVIGYSDLPSRLAKQSSQLYGSNLWRLLEEMCPKKDGMIEWNLEDEIQRGTTVIDRGNVIWPAPPPKLSVPPAQTPKNIEATLETKVPIAKKSGWVSAVLLGIAAVVFWLIGQHAPTEFMNQFTVFALSCFVGYLVVWNVTAALHTPLMSVTNAISGIIAVGALLQVSSDNMVVKILAMVALFVSAINIFGGFWVTQRMLSMFKK